MYHAFYNGEAEHHLKDGSVRHFSPRGPMRLVHLQVRAGRGAREDRSKVADWGTGGLSARLFVGLNVGSTPTWTIDDVMKATYAFMASRGTPGGSFIAQKGLYYDKVAQQTVPEDSVQIVVFDEDGLSMDAFCAKVVDLGKHLREQFDQNVVIVEIQKAGVTQKLRGILRDSDPTAEGMKDPCK